MQSEEHQALIIEGPSIASKAINILSDEILQANQEVVNNLLSTVQLYFIILGSLLFMIFVFASWKTINYLKERVILVNFLLTLIPLDKWNEEATIHMLKQINKI